VGCVWGGERESEELRWVSNWTTKAHHRCALLNVHLTHESQHVPGVVSNCL
jgi:hypothetical protein